MLENVLYFISGMIASSLFSYVFSVGWSIIVLKETQKSCAALFVICEQGLQEILQLKYIVMEDSKKSEQNITAQKYIDQMNINSVKKSVMKNYVNTFPAKYSSIIEYESWDELQDYVNNIIKNGGKI